MIILHISPINMTKTNGFRFSVPGIVNAQNKLSGISSGLMTVKDMDLVSEEELKNYDFTMMAYTSDIQTLNAPFNKPDIVVFHAIYLRRFINLAKQLVKLNIPYIIVPRVSLTAGAQNTKRFKKLIGNTLYFNRFIKNASRIQFLTENERLESRKFQHSNFVVGNGIMLPDQMSPKKREQIINITYLGRYAIHHKGLDLLIDSLHSIRDTLIEKNVFLNMYGSDDGTGRDFLLNKIKEYNLEKLVRVNAPILGKSKSEVLANTDIFIAPSRYEGHPMAVIEAMAYYTPCILTKGTNMLEDLNDYDAGWETRLDSNHIAEIILQAIDDAAITQKGLNARRLVEDHCTWDQMANLSVAEYRKAIENLTMG